MNTAEANIGLNSTRLGVGALIRALAAVMCVNKALDSDCRRDALISTAACPSAIMRSQDRALSRSQ
jgi:hypothetical protein